MSIALLLAANAALGGADLLEEEFTLCEEAGKQQISCTLCPGTSNLKEIYARTRGEWQISFDVGADGKPDFNSVEFLNTPRGSNAGRMKAMTRVAFVGSTFPTGGEPVKAVQCKMELTR